MESVGSAASVSVIDACTQDCANLALGAASGENSSRGARQWVGARGFIFEDEGVAQSERAFRTRLYEYAVGSRPVRHQGVS